MLKRATTTLATAINERVERIEANPKLLVRVAGVATCYAILWRIWPTP